jgi:hypothetical protein
MTLHDGPSPVYVVVDLDQDGVLCLSPTQSAAISLEMLGSSGSVTTNLMLVEITADVPWASKRSTNEAVKSSYLDSFLLFALKKDLEWTKIDVLFFLFYLEPRLTIQARFDTSWSLLSNAQQRRR